MQKLGSVNRTDGVINGLRFLLKARDWDKKAENTSHQHLQKLRIVIDTCNVVHVETCMGLTPFASFASHAGVVKRLSAKVPMQKLRPVLDACIYVYNLRIKLNAP